jgi:cyclohexadienyl dehydratase
VLAWALAASAAAAEAPGVLRVGTSGDYAPFSLPAPGTPEGVDGFDVALARAYAEERGLTLELVPFSWPTLLEDLAAGRFDVAMSGITVRPERSLAGRFSVPVAESGAVVLLQSHTPARSLDKLDQRRFRIGVNAGGHLERVTRARFRRATLVSIPENQGVLRAFLERGVDAVVTDTLEAPGWQAQAEKSRRLGPFTRDRKALLVHPDREELATDLDRWLLAREADGTLAKLRRRWLDAPKAPRLATPLAALVAATDERLALMPWIVTSKRRDVRPIADPVREKRVIEAGLAAVARAAEAAGVDPPPEEDVRAFYRAQIETAKQVQLRVGRDESYVPEEPIPSLEDDLRPALIRIGERIATLLVALPDGLGEAHVATVCRDGLRSPWLDERGEGQLARAFFEFASWRRRVPPPEGEAPSGAPEGALPEDRPLEDAVPEPAQRESSRASQPAAKGSSRQVP